jgi:hypothetical protein
MKIRKILPLLVLAVVSLLALSSCDQMLEALFPADTNGGAGNNSITVDAHTYYSTVQGDIYYGPLTVVLMKGGAAVEKNTYWLNYYGINDMEAAWTFNNLADGPYSVYVWIDYNNNGQPTGDYDYGQLWGQTVSVSGGQAVTAADYVNYSGYNAQITPVF